MRKWLILLSALSATAASGAPAWTWVDANGTVHFSDQARAGRATSGAARARRASARPGARPATFARADTDVAAGAPVSERSKIVSPAEQETLWNIGGTLNVQVEIRAAVCGRVTAYDLTYDGQRREPEHDELAAVTLPDVFRGVHTLQVVVIDAAGTELTRSATRTFFVQQTSTSESELGRAPGRRVRRQPPATSAVRAVGRRARAPRRSRQHPPRTTTALVVLDDGAARSRI